MKNYCEDIFKNAKNKNLKTALGGAVSAEGADFIRYFLDKNLIDKYETRKLVYKNLKNNKIIDGIKLGVKFELLWLKSKRRYYHRIKDEDEKKNFNVRKKI